MTATAVLVRHGETTWNRDRRVQGWAPTPLTDRGREQANAVAAHIADGYDVDRLVASDLRRTRETARPIGERVGVDPEFDRGWRERDFGTYQGLDYEAVFDEAELSVAEFGRDAAEHVPESGESMVEMHARVLDAWRAFVGGLAAGQTGVVVAHGGPLRAVVGHLSGEDAVTSLGRDGHHNCALTEVRVDPAAAREAADGDGPPDYATMVRENERPF